MTDKADYMEKDFENNTRNHEKYLGIVTSRLKGGKTDNLILGVESKE